MRDSGGKLAHRFQLLRLKKLFPQMFTLGNIFAHSFIADNHAVLMNGANAHGEPYLAAVLAKALALKVLHGSKFLHGQLEFLAAFGVGIKLVGNVGDAGDHLLRGIIAESKGHRRVHAEKAALRGALKDADNGRVEDSSILEFRLPERALHLLPLGDVFAHSFIADHHTLLTNGAYAHGDPDLAAIFATGLAFKVLHAADSVHHQHEFKPTLGVGKEMLRHIGDAGRHFIRGIVAESKSHRRVHAKKAALRRALKDADNGLVKDSSVLLFRLPQRSLHHFACGDVMAYARYANDMAIAVKQRHFCRQDMNHISRTVHIRFFMVI